MKKIGEVVLGIIIAVCELVVGLALLIDPSGFTAKNIIIAGLFLVIAGINNIYGYFRNNTKTKSAGDSLSIGILAAIGGLLCMIYPERIAAAFPDLTIIYGTGMLALGAMKVEITVNMIRLHFKNWWISAVSATLSVICAVVIVFNPMGVASMQWTFAALSLILVAIIDFVTVFYQNKEDYHKIC